MSTNLDEKCRELFEIILMLAREIRCCSCDEAICRDLTFHQFMILDAVVRKGALGLTDLRRLICVEKSTTAHLVDLLVQRGLLKRDRATHVSITEEGKDAYRQAWGCLEEFFEGIAKNIPAGRRGEVLEAVQVFTGAMRKAAAKCCE